MDEQWLMGQLSRVRFPSERKASAVLVLLAQDGVVLEVRSSKLRAQPGEICLPGGRMEPGETPEECALRETQEELGLPSEQIHVLGSLGELSFASGQSIYPILALWKGEMPLPLQVNPDEVEEVFLLPVQWLKEQTVMPYTYTLIPTGTEDFPPEMQAAMKRYPGVRKGGWYRYEGKLIWGLTERVLQRLLKLLKE